MIILCAKVYAILGDPHDTIAGVLPWSNPMSCIWRIRGWILALAGRGR
jgi:hypothetical protein